ncbi:hypothetical protein LIER_16401 [Lithospermum erythrorhizon]|uniref:Integrase catalytic domain-containing protein n=1 Tax=Lithospermum erythrorhizon TaxID=34254 RepID=A0AAV3Q7Y8_LITER
MLCQKCHACKKLSTVSQKPASTLTPMVSPISFTRWGIDLVGMFSKAKGGVEYAVVAVDYFTKWVETVPLRKPKDNGPQFEGSILAQFCQNYGIERRFSPFYYPQSNSTVLWSLRTTLSDETGETPFALVYGTEVVLQVEARAEDVQHGKSSCNYSRNDPPIVINRWGGYTAPSHSESYSNQGWTPRVKA